MIITYPIKQEYIKGKEQRVVPDKVYDLCETASGTFPVGKNSFWHGGVHLFAAATEPIRAIADGEVVAYRYCETDSGDEFFTAPYSTSFVLLKHVADCGTTSIGTTTIVFYSLYMHLAPWASVKTSKNEGLITFVADHKEPKKHNGKIVENQFVTVEKKEKPLFDGKVNGQTDNLRVNRGDVIGFAGLIPDNDTKPSRGIHFEIFMENVDFLANPNKNIWGNVYLTSDLHVNYGDAPSPPPSPRSLSIDPLIEIVPNGAPDKNTGNRKFKFPDKSEGWLRQNAYVSREIEVEKKVGKNVQKIKRPAFFASASDIEVFAVDPDRDRETLAKGSKIIPWTSPWLSKGEFREVRVDGKDYIQVLVVEKLSVGWAEKQLIAYQSDADWRGFEKISETGAFSADGFADHEAIEKLIAQYDKSKDGVLEKSEAPKDVQEKLRKLIVSYPSEWDGSDNGKKYERVTTDTWKGQKLSASDFEKFKTHLKRLQFWQEAQAVTKLPKSATLWHPHPIAFIEHLAKCMNLSKSELALMYPDTNETTRERYREAINKCTVKYFLSNRYRIGHLIGQSIIECGSLNDMLEGSPNSLETDLVQKGSTKTFRDYEKKGQTLGNVFKGDGLKFRGRGMKQLTGRSHISNYLKTIGLAVGGSRYYHSEAEWWGGDGWPKYKEDDDLSKIDPKAHKHRPPKLLIDVEEINKTPFLAVEAGFFFWLTDTDIYKHADNDDSIKVSLIVNRHATGTFNKRKTDTNKVLKELL